MGFPASTPQHLSPCCHSLESTGHCASSTPVQPRERLTTWTWLPRNPRASWYVTCALGTAREAPQVSQKRSNFTSKTSLGCGLLASTLMLSFKQNFLDLLLGRQPNVRALRGQAVPLRSKASLSSPAGASRGQLSAPAGPRLRQHALLILSTPHGKQLGSRSPSGRSEVQL